jgi:hypothetical protein
MDGLRRTRLTSPPQAFAFPEPQGSFSIEHSSVSWFLRQAKEREWYMVHDVRVFTQGNDLPCNP